MPGKVERSCEGRRGLRKQRLSDYSLLGDCVSIHFGLCPYLFGIVGLICDYLFDCMFDYM